MSIVVFVVYSDIDGTHCMLLLTYCIYLEKFLYCVKLIFHFPMQLYYSLCRTKPRSSLVLQTIISDYYGIDI
jgi:hypothetical protein